MHTALRERPYIGDLGARPLLLMLMATLHSSWGQLPEDRAALYEETVKLLLGRWQRAREVRGPEGEPVVEPGISEALKAGEERIRLALERLALGVHARQGSHPNREAEPADIAEGEILVAFKDLLGQVAPDVLLHYLQDRAGLLVSPSEGIYAFPHRSFQEYLAACHLSNQPEFALELRKRVEQDPEWWREVFLLGVGKAKQGGLGSAINILNALLPAETEDVEHEEDLHWKLAVLAGQALLELRLPEQSTGQPLCEALLKRTRRWLVKLIEEGRLSPRERITGGDVLGGLGDPRFDEHCFHLPKRYRASPEPLLGFVEIPAGPFTMGSDREDELAFDDERPAHRLDVPDFYIGRYPVTNAQYRCFLEAGGYARSSYWTDAGWAWRNGAVADLSPIDDEDFKKRYADWLAKRPKEKREQPYFWDDAPWNTPTHPVVGVCWYEALVYCRWLDAQLHERLENVERADGAAARYRVRLPTEPEWEKAARGANARRWPWGDTWCEGAANTKETGLQQTSPAGMFPQGASVDSVLDMAGNVWEWTLSRWGKTSIRTPDYAYPYNRGDGRERLEGQDLRPVRGGSWVDDRGGARCAYRGGGFPDGFDSGLGFRVVLSLAISEF